jgi:hypothetical protein
MIKTKAYNMLRLSQGEWANSPQAKEFRLPLKEHREMLCQRQVLREARTRNMWSRKRTPPAGIPPGVEPAQSRMPSAGVIPFGMKGRGAFLLLSVVL